MQGMKICKKRRRTNSSSSDSASDEGQETFGSDSKTTGLKLKIKLGGSQNYDNAPRNIEMESLGWTYPNMPSHKYTGDGTVLEDDGSLEGDDKTDDKDSMNEESSPTGNSDDDDIDYDDDNLEDDDIGDDDINGDFIDDDNGGNDNEYDNGDQSSEGGSEQCNLSDEGVYSGHQKNAENIDATDTSIYGMTITPTSTKKLQHDVGGKLDRQLSDNFFREDYDLGTQKEIGATSQKFEETTENSNFRKMNILKRKERFEKQIEDNKTNTIEKLLYKSQAKERKEIVKKTPSDIRYINNTKGISISLPIGTPYPLVPQKAVDPPLPVMCSVSGCSNRRKYSCSRTTLPICSLHCYRIVQAHIDGLTYTTE